jgi:hypothetical protein
MRVWLGLAIWLCLTVSGAAQPAPDRLDVLQSAWHADRSAVHLRQGNRSAAILTALRGIPADPDTEDQTTYPEAFAALFHAVASRAFRADLLSGQTAIWSPDGLRAVSESAGAGIDSPRMNGAILWDAVNGTRIADLLPLRGWAEGWTLPNEIAVSPFSPDSRLLVLAESQFGGLVGFEGHLLILDATTGAAVGRVPGDSFMGFSSDGATFLAKSMYSDEVRLYDTASLQDLGRVTSAEIGGDVITSGHPDASGGFILALASWGDADGQNARVRLARFDRSGLRITTDLSDQPGYTLGGSWPIAMGDTRSGYSVLTPDTGEALVIHPDGRIAGRIEGFYSGYARLAFVRDGRAIAVQEGYGFDDVRFAGLRVYDLTGAPLEPEPMDVVPFLDWIADGAGRIVGMPYHAMQIGDGRDTLHGMLLYNQVWPQIPADLQAQIEAERIVRP